MQTGRRHYQLPTIAKFHFEVKTSNKKTSKNNFFLFQLPFTSWKPCVPRTSGSGAVTGSKFLKIEMIRTNQGGSINRSISALICARAEVVVGVMKITFI